MENLKISEITTNKKTQARVSISEDTVQEYAERMLAGDDFPPVDVFHDGSDYYLADGFHRVLAAKRALIESVQCNVHKGTLSDARWFAIGANKTNGQRMSRGDVKRAVEIALTEFPDRTQQAVADHVGCSRPYVTQTQKQLVTSNKLDIPETRVGADGKERPTTYSKDKPQTERSDTNEDDDDDGIKTKEKTGGEKNKKQYKGKTQDVLTFHSNMNDIKTLIEDVVELQIPNDKRASAVTTMENIKTLIDETITKIRRLR